MYFSLLHINLSIAVKLMSGELNLLCLSALSRHVVISIVFRRGHYRESHPRLLGASRKS